ncbi:MAG: bifunctional homocysteine S-methyltransferase/methylenetetrahydrofolate reductase [Bacillota bacterium]|nr:bifunctional homocysteine S-methyltransferase/methylenetetrahydrofolate reductase [Bacillota bacterium]
MLRDFLKSNILITDGAMGTYYNYIKGNGMTFSELENIKEPEIIEKIHNEYIEAGAKLIRTNTFSANTITLNTTREEVKKIIRAGCIIAEKASKNKEIFIGASIGPIPEASSEKIELDKNYILDEYKFIVDIFLEMKIDIFIFETFSSTEYLKEITEYVKSKNNKAFILTQFATTFDGYTRKGISNSRIIEEAKKINTIDAYGFNCGIGPAHLFKSLQKYDFTGDIVSVLPNAGYPEIINERTIFVQNPEYFSGIMLQFLNIGVRILGGCCGTTPVHIKKLSDKLKLSNDINLTKVHKEDDAKLQNKSDIDAENFISVEINEELNGNTKNLNSAFSNLNIKLSNKFAIAVELDPPFDTDISKIMNGARLLKEAGVDIITIADSPMARARMDSCMLAAKIKREVGIDVMPHICCRDKNINALKSTLLAAHMEGIRNVLAVTGDPVSGSSKDEIKSVFNLNSMKLMELIKEMNKEIFVNEPFEIGGALNLNVRNKDIEMSRLYKKIEHGSSFFLTQPIFSDDTTFYLSKLDKTRNFKILAGIMPIVSYKNAQFLNNEIPGIQISEEYINRFNIEMTREEAEKEGIKLSVEIAEKVKTNVDGLYFITPFNRVSMIIKIIKELKL